MIFKTKEEIGEKQLAEEIAIALKDFFNGEIGLSENVVHINFGGGQNFLLTVKKAAE